MKLKIYDDIIADQQREEHRWCCGTDGVTFSDIDAAVASVPEDDSSIDLLIHCCGGSVSEGWAIVDKLRATGKTITATIDGNCASMAVSILLAASVRRAQPHATIHIHKPFYPPYSLPDAYNEDDLKRMVADLENETGKMLDWYQERTGADRAILEAIMTEDRDMDMTEALSLGFIQEIMAPMSASTKSNWKQSLSHNSMSNTKAGVINALANLLGVKVSAVENYVVITADGQELTVDKPEGEEIAVGDAASPDGNFVLEDGRTVVVEEGVVTEIKEPSAEPTAEPENPENKEKKDEEEGGMSPEEVEALKAENEELKAKVAELEAKLAEAEGEKPSEEDRKIVEKVNKAGGIKWLNEVAKSNYVPAQRQTSSKAASISKTAARLAELKGNK